MCYADDKTRYRFLLRAKHIKVCNILLKGLINKGLIELLYVPMDGLVADILMKPLTGWKFQYLLYN